MLPLLAREAPESDGSACQFGYGLALDQRRVVKPGLARVALEGDQSAQLVSEPQQPRRRHRGEAWPRRLSQLGLQLRAFAAVGKRRAPARDGGQRRYVKAASGEMER